jgi:hypothetical protein
LSDRQPHAGRRSRLCAVTDSRWLRQGASLALPFRFEFQTAQHVVAPLSSLHSSSRRRPGPILRDVRCCGRSLMPALLPMGRGVWVPAPRAQLRTRPGRRGYSFAFSRRAASEVCYQILHPQNSEGAGNAGCALHPRSHVRLCIRMLHMSIQGSGEHPTFPAQWLYGL